MNRKTLSVLAVGLLIMAATGYLAYPSQPKSLADLSKAKFMHCPKCMREKMYTPAGIDIPCAYCEKPLIATTESVTKTGNKPASPYSQLTMLLLVEVVLLMGAIWYVTRKKTADVEEEYFYFNCPKCKQKIRYRQHQIGVTAQCRRCRKAFVYPEGSQEEYVE
jgi:ribosomal protein S27E